MVIADQESPKLDTVDNLKPNLIPIPFVIGTHNAGNRRVINIIRIPETQLPHRWVQSELKHISCAIGQVRLGAVPDTMMDHHHCARFADDWELPQEVLIPSDVRFADAAVMAAGENHRSPHFTRRIMAEVKELDAKISSQSGSN
jgi:hypothetical protein